MAPVSPTAGAVRFIIASFASATLLLAGCSSLPGGNDTATSDDVTPTTARSQARVARSYDIADTQSFADAKRGFIARPGGKVSNASGTVLWDYDAFGFETGPAPASVNPSLWRQALLNNQVGLFKVVDGIYQLRGFDLANITLIEGRTGWIVVDTLTSSETAAAAMAFARRHLGDRQVSAVIFTHSHVDHFGGALGVVSADEVTRRQVPVVAPVGFIEEATSENVLVGPAMGRRSTYMYGNRLERSARGLVDAGLGKAVSFGTVGILQPTLIVHRAGQQATIDGVDFVFQNVPGSEAPAELTFYLPQLKAYGGAEMLSHTMHNLYTLRGAKVRDALKWSQYIDDGIEQIGEAEVYFGQHHWPVWGHQRIVDFMEKQRDVYRYTHDQTVRMINAGLTPREIAETIRLPQSLDTFMNAHGYYGTLKHNAKAVYQFYMGWFDGNPANLDPLPPRAAGERYVALAGGADRLMATAQAAFDAGDYRWTAELLNHLVFAEDGHAAAKALLARTYRQLGYAAESAAWRNFYLSGAYELQHGKPQQGVTPAMFIDLLEHTPIERFLEAMAGALNGPDAEGQNLKINLRFSDLAVNYVLHIDNAVLHFRQAAPAADADASLTLTKPIFLKMATGTAGLKDTVFNGAMKVDGNALALVRFFGLIDKAPGNFAIVSD